MLINNRWLYPALTVWGGRPSPSTDVLTPAQLPPDIVAQFPGDVPLLEDTENRLHSCSVHASCERGCRTSRGIVAAQDTGAASGELAVNLSSDRVRVALSLIEGIRNDKASARCSDISLS